MNWAIERFDGFAVAATGFSTVGQQIVDESKYSARVAADLDLAWSCSKPEQLAQDLLDQ